MSVLKIRNTSTGTWESIDSIKGDKGDQGFVSTDLKRAMLQLAQQIPCTDGRGPRYYQDLWNALYGDDYIENFTRVGEPQIENGILTTSATSWIESPEAFDPGSSPWELTVKLYRPSIAGKYERFFDSGGVGVETAYSNQNARLSLYSDDGTISSGNVQKSIPAGAWRWLKVAFSGNCYDFAISSDGFTYTWIAGGNTPFEGYIPSTMRTSTPIKAGTFKLASGTGNYTTVAKFDLRETEIKINGQTWWNPYIFE